MNDDLHLFLSQYLLTPLGDEPISVTLPTAAVLVPIINHPHTPTLLFTQRSKQLRQHPGQVAFPGGKHDLADYSLYETALRETYEEVGITPQSIQLLGELPLVNSRTGHSVKPFLALVEPGFILDPNSDEVAEVFEVPLSYLLNSHNYVTLWVGHSQAQRQVHFLPYSSHLIRGMTANILFHLSTHIATSPPSNKKR
ncbi:CoA pyrophosphatase [Rosenbergiella sp. S61]|uniref:CoA pyrophosphatase n=1 Tax=Rosenbergiella gaditana TaxID=2726987 RepID=A0ABS5SST1_9GAMM|nr:CoA pyrophosphatase [Rosenbergiella gaditana]MBT0722969.1 CoA pyrophosphatase [Rosenbergiella gaditana]